MYVVSACSCPGAAVHRGESVQEGAGIYSLYEVTPPPPPPPLSGMYGSENFNGLCIFVFLIVCFTSYFMFSIAVLPHRPGVVYYHLLLRQETRIPRVAPFSLRIEIWDLFVHRGQKSYTPTAFGKLWTTPGVRCMKHASS